MSPRPRRLENRKLPERWRWYHGAFRYSVPHGDEKYFDGKRQFKLGKTLTAAYGEMANRLRAKREAEEAAAVAAGSSPSERPRPATVKAGLERYLLEVTPLKPSARTRENDKRNMPILILRFGHFPIAGDGMPEPRHVYEYVTNRRNKRTGARALTAAHREMELFFHAYTKFVQWGCLSRHPFNEQVRLDGDLAIPQTDQRYVEDWELEAALSLKPFRKRGSVLMCQAYIRLKLELKGLRMTDMLLLQPARHFTDDGILVTAQKTRESTGKSLLYRWTPERRAAVETALAARPIDIGPYLFCNSTGECYVDPATMRADAFINIWQAFMARVIDETAVTEGFSERQIRAKVGSDAETVEEAQRVLGHASPQVTRKHYRRKPEVIK